MIHLVKNELVKWGLFGWRPMTAGSVTLKDGSVVYLRPIEASDCGLIHRIYAQLDDESRYMRFNTAMEAISPSFLERLSKQLAIHAATDGFGMLAYRICEDNDQTIEPVGMVCYVNFGAGSAELEVTVIDEWQGKGLGSALFKNLIRHARSHQQPMIEAYVNPRNYAMQALIVKSGVAHHIDSEGAMLHFRLLVG